MLEHSRGASGERRTVDFNALADEALNLAYHGARAQDQSFNITLERNFEAGIPPIDLNPQDITRVCLNLIGNGFYATRKRQQASDAAFEPRLTIATRDPKAVDDNAPRRVITNVSSISTAVTCAGSWPVRCFT